MFFFFFFFFSSRRRHTRLTCDWSSDVCSSDLGAAEDPGEDVRVPVDHVGVVVTPCGDQPDVFGDWSMGRAGPLAIYDFVKVLGRTDISRLQNDFPPRGHRRFSFRGTRLGVSLTPGIHAEKTEFSITRALSRHPADAKDVLEIT